jgi:beta-N-acetylhexosaminidase
MTELRRLPGPVMLDLAGTEPDSDDLRRLRHPLTGGVILFARNFSDRAQLVALIDEIRSVREGLIVAVDHEGGRVQRFKTDGFTVLPPMRALGRLWDSDVLAATRAASAVGYVMACELRACDIDLSFTPVLDLDYGKCAAIGDRAMHLDPRVVTLLAKSLNHGLALAGMANCGKHFPGHGFVEADSHVAAPVDTRSLNELLADATPYDWLGLTLAAVMPAHVIYPKVDDKPAGFSTIWLQEVLRRRLKFDGVIFSDDLSMAAARAAGSVAEAATAALFAGCDMALMCNSPEDTDAVLGALRYVPTSVSVRRIKRLAARGKAVSWKKLEDHPEYLAARQLIADLGTV